jgi:hypothetical protein
MFIKGEIKMDKEISKLINQLTPEDLTKFIKFLSQLKRKEL